MFQPIGMWSSR